MRRARFLWMRDSVQLAVHNRIGNSRPRTRAFVAAATFVFAAAGFTATPASAQIIDGNTYEDTASFSYTACDGVDIRQDDHISGKFMIRQHGSETKAYVFDNFKQDDVYINLQTNRSWTSTTNITHLDVKIDLVAGTVYRYTWQDAGTFKVFDDTGKLAYVQAGLRRESALVDTHGNLNLDDDDYLTQLSFELRGHYPGGDFCADLAAFTTG